MKMLHLRPFDYSAAIRWNNAEAQSIQYKQPLKEIHFQKFKKGKKEKKNGKIERKKKTAERKIPWLQNNY